MYQRPSRLEITLQAPMPTLVQLSTVGRPLFQGNHKLHVMEPFCLGRRRQPFYSSTEYYHFACASTSSVSTYVCIHSLFIPQAVYTHICLYIYAYIVGLIFAIVLWLHIGGAFIIHSTELTARNNFMQPPLFCCPCITASSSTYNI